MKNFQQDDMKEIGVFDFLGVHLPDYHSNDLIARMDDCARFLDDELTREEIKEKGFDKATVSEVFQEHEELQNKVFDRAIKAFADDYGERQRLSCSDALIKNDYNDPHDVIMAAPQPSILDNSTLSRENSRSLFTGETDLNGNEINVGDIIREFYEEDKRFIDWIIYYHKGLKEYKAIRTTNENANVPFDSIDTNRCGRIGNVHRHPELVHIDISGYDFSVSATSHLKANQYGTVIGSEWRGDFFYGSVVDPGEDSHIRIIVDFDYIENSATDNKKIIEFLESEFAKKECVACSYFDESGVNVFAREYRIDEAMRINDEFKNLLKNVSLEQIIGIPKQSIKDEAMKVNNQTELDVAIEKYTESIGHHVVQINRDNSKQSAKKENVFEEDFKFSLKDFSQEDMDFMLSEKSTPGIILEELVESVDATGRTKIAGHPNVMPETIHGLVEGVVKQLWGKIDEDTIISNPKTSSETLKLLFDNDEFTAHEKIIKHPNAEPIKDLLTQGPTMLYKKMTDKQKLDLAIGKTVIVDNVIYKGIPNCRAKIFVKNNQLSGEYFPSKPEKSQTKTVINKRSKIKKIK